jgi:hypothetical protein
VASVNRIDAGVMFGGGSGGAGVKGVDDRQPAARIAAQMMIRFIRSPPFLTALVHRTSRVPVTQCEDAELPQPLVVRDVDGAHERLEVELIRMCRSILPR